MPRLSPSLLILPALLASIPAFADETTEARLREALRAATDQVQQLQAENASLQAQKALAPAAPPVAAPPKDMVSRGVYERAVARLDAQHQADQAEIARLKEAADQVAKAAVARDTDKSRSDAALAEAQQRIKTLEEKNAKLVEIGNDLLQRLQNIGWRDAFGAEEPFIGTERVELQTLAQDDGDKILDNKAGP